MTVTWAIVILACATRLSADRLAEPGRWSVVRLVAEQQSVRKEMAVQDVYKLLYQATFGVEHILEDTTAVRLFLEDELAGVESTATGEDLVERISTDDAMVRINLRPFKRLNLPPALIVECMFLSSTAMRPDTGAFLRQWEDFVEAVHAGLLLFPAGDLGAWDARVRGGEIRAVHHSVAYAKANRPAYRVALRRIAEAVFSREGTRLR